MGERKQVPAMHGYWGMSRQLWGRGALCQAFCRPGDPLGDGGAEGPPLPQARSTAVLELQTGDEKSPSSTFCSNSEGTALTRLLRFWLSQNEMTNS